MTFFPSFPQQPQAPTGWRCPTCDEAARREAEASEPGSFGDVTARRRMSQRLNAEPGCPWPASPCTCGDGQGCISWQADQPATESTPQADQSAEPDWRKVAAYFAKCANVEAVVTSDDLAKYQPLPYRWDAERQAWLLNR